MRRIAGLICAGVLGASCAFAQTTTPPVTQAQPAGGFQRPPLTPEQQAAEKPPALLCLPAPSNLRRLDCSRSGKRVSGLHGPHDTGKILPMHP